MHRHIGLLIIKFSMFQVFTAFLYVKLPSTHAFTQEQTYRQACPTSVYGCKLVAAK